MSKYIDADKLIQDIDERGYDFWCSDVDIYNAKIIVSEQPTVDVQEVKHGKWEQNSFDKRIYYCSECGRHIEDGSKKPQEHFPYCHCGVKMDKSRY